MSIEINHVIIHKLNKERNEPIEPSTIRPAVLSASNESIVRVVESISELYGKKNNSAQYGVFINGEGSGNFPREFSHYTEDLSQESFMALAELAMGEIYGKAKDQPLSTGGFILFVDYFDHKNNRSLITAMVKQKAGFRIVDLNIEDLEYIDLSGLHQAAKIGFDRFDAYQNASDIDKQELNYLSFVSPKSNKSAAGYFISALGCQAGTPSAKATKFAASATGQFFKKHEELVSNANDVNRKVRDYLKEKMDSGSPAKLSDIEDIAREFFPKGEEHEEKAEYFANELYAHLNGEDVQLPNEFTVNKGAYNKSVFVNYKSENLSISFEKDDLGITSDAKIHFSEDENKLIIHELPEALIEQIKATLKR